MTDKKLVSIIVSKIIIGELSFSKLEKMVREKKKEEELNSFSKYFQKMYVNIGKWIKEDIRFVDMKIGLEVFDALNNLNADDENELISYIAKKTGRNITTLKRKILSDNIDELYIILSSCINKFCNESLGVTPYNYWESLNDSERVKLLKNIESVISNL